MDILQYLTTIVFGEGASQQLPRALAEVGISRPLIVTDKGIVRAGLLDKVLAPLQYVNPDCVYTDTPPNPTEEAAEIATALYKAHGCDGLVAIGGGSPLDLAKAVALLATHEGPLSRYTGMASMGLIGAQAAPMIAVPTTAGTGSEVGRGALIRLAAGSKLVIASPYLLPKRALCDPELTLGLPPALTAGTGMDAFTHCVETFLSPRFNPVAEAIALDGAVRAWKSIEVAVDSPRNIKARAEMMMASIQGGLAFQKGLGAVHSLSHPLGALTAPSLHHGTVNAVLLPHVLKFNEGHVGDKFDRLKQALGLNAQAELAHVIARLNERLGIPRSLREMGVDSSVCEQVIDGATKDHSTSTNPRPVDRAGFATLFTQALG